jgi:hypothetical protein
MESRATPRLLAFAVFATCFFLLGSPSWWQLAAACCLWWVAEFSRCGLRKRRRHHLAEPQKPRAARLIHEKSQLAQELRNTRQHAQNLQETIDQLKNDAVAHADQLARQNDVHAEVVQQLESDHHQAQVRFAVTAAKELRGPLQSLAGQLGLLLARPDVPADIAQILAGLRDPLLQVARSAGSLHEYAQGERSASLRELIDLEEVLADVQGVARARLGPRFEMTCRVADRPFVVGDAAELREVLRLLLDRMVSAPAAGGRLAVSARESQGTVCIAVSADEAGDVSAAEESIDLAWCHAVLCRHGGELRKTPSGFTLALPAADLSVSVAPSAIIDRPARKRKLRVRLTGHDPLVTEALTAMVGQLGHAVTTSAGEDVDLVIASSDDTTSPTQAPVLRVYGREDLANDGHADAVLRKPLTLTQLREKLHSAASRVS